MTGPTNKVHRFRSMPEFGDINLRRGKLSGLMHRTAKHTDMEKLYAVAKKALPNQEILRVTEGDYLDDTVAEIHAVTDDGTPFYISDLAVPAFMYEKWKEFLPRVVPHYAIKCNPDIAIVAVLAECGANFDCASPYEMDIVLNLGVDPSRIVYANPCKQTAAIAYAKQVGVRGMTFDNEVEIDKVLSIYPEAELILRIATDDSHSALAFSTKFGATIPEARRLIRLCKEKKANLIGIAFHVGSGCTDVTAYREALTATRSLFDYAKTIGINMNHVDIGGGFPGADHDENMPETNDRRQMPVFRKYAKEIAKDIDALFPDKSVTISSEPGRYFASSVTIEAAAVIAKRPVYDVASDTADIPDHPPASEIKAFKYYLSDGVYGSMNNALTDHVRPIPHVLFTSNPDATDASKYKTATLFGPTCDSLDTIVKDVALPELELGDWLFFRNMGAYTQCLITRFNGFPPPNSHYIMTMPK